jgi:hypothetical protein
MNIDKYKNIMFLQADGEGGGGGGESIAGTGGEVSHGAAAIDVPKIGTGERALPEHAEGVPHSGEPPAQPPAFDASKFAKEFGDTLGTTLRPIIEQATPKAPPMTPEEARKILNIWEPDEQWYKSYDNLETRADAIASMRDALIKQADTLAQFRMQEMVDQLRQEVMPHLTSSTQLVNQQREERFRTTYPQLADEGLQPLVKAVAQDFVDRKQTFKSETELFKALAGGVEAVLKVNNPGFKLEAVSDGTTQGRSSRSLPVTTPGGSGGTGRREGQGKEVKPRGMAIFDKL